MIIPRCLSQGYLLVSWNRDNSRLSWVDPNGANNGTLQSVTVGTAGSPKLSETFSYDNLNRLTKASEDRGWSQGYSYDQYGSMWMPPASNTLGAPAVGVRSARRQANVYSGNRNTNAQYDAAGNLTAFGSLAVSYDAENRQITAGSYHCVYDGAGQRVGKMAADGTTTTFVYDAFGQMTAEYGSAETIACNTCYVSTDHLGSTRLVVDQDGNMVARHDYAPYGQEIGMGIGGRTSL